MTSVRPTVGVETGQDIDRVSADRTTTIVASLLFLFAFVVFGSTAATSDTEQLNLDAWTANYASWTIAATGEPWVDLDRIPQLAHNPLRDQWITHKPDGRAVIARAPGVVAASIPAYMLTHPGTMTTAPGGWTAAFLMAGAIALLFLSLKDSLSIRHAALAALAFGFTTPVWSVAADGVWPHTITVFGICGMAFACARGHWLWVGIFGGVALWGRVHAALIVAVVGLLVGWRRRSPRVVLRAGCASGTILGLMCVWTHWIYGTWDPTGSYDTSVFENYAAAHRLSVANQLGFWISPDRGILVWTPVILLLLPALCRAWRDLPDWAASMAIGGIGYTVLQGVLNRFSGGDLFYGYRYGLEALACLTPALCLATPRMGRVARTLLGPVLTIQLLAIALGAITNGHFLPEGDKWSANAFVSAVNDAGFAAWILLTVAACLGLLGQRLWIRLGDRP
jgi:alpha-1,2-mannosyltransferase